MNSSDSDRAVTEVPIAGTGSLTPMGDKGLDVAQRTPLPLTTIRTHRRLVGAMAARLPCTGADSATQDLGFEPLAGATA